MKKAILFLLFVSFWLTPNLILAQPIGCMEAKQKIKLSPPTTEELAFIQASNERSDTIDILNYEITLDVDFNIQEIDANCIVTFSPKMMNIDYLALDLLDLDVDSVFFNGNPVNYDFDGLLLEIFFTDPLNMGSEENVQVFYHGKPTVDPSGFGGFDFNGGYAYNLGIGLASNPYNFGRSWFPCFDNFVERSTYDFNVISPSNRKGYCVGTFMGETELPSGKILRRYELDQPIPTYLAGVAVSTYGEYNEVHQGQYGPVDIQLVAKTDDLNNMITSFASLGEAIDALEYWYGPYVWDRVGFVSTVVGAMEHPANIAYPDFVGLGGDDFGQKRLMAHELAHCWFGNIVTLSSAADMWFKEGNAEYGAHLFTEWIGGQEAFIDHVKDNFLEEVLRSAHYDDDGFQQLSGIPFEHTYGTHTYRKGASMIHNLRGYLGDSLFRVGQRQVLANHAYGAVDGATYRDELIDATGQTDIITSFFDDWIFAPGYAAYEIDSVKLVPSGSEYEATVHIQQKLRAAPHFHTNTPIEITFMDNDWNHHTSTIMVSDEFTTVEVLVPFEPAIWFLNGNGKLNIAKLQNELVIDSPINRNLAHSEFRIRVNEIVDSAYFRVEHYWVGPDEIGNNPDLAQISQNHFWRVDGIWPDVFDAQGSVNYRASAPELDADLTSNTEDSLILIYRPYPGYPWTEYDNYVIINTLPGDGQGTIAIGDLKKGDYAFANGTLDVVSTVDIFKEDLVDIYPNPATEYLNLKGDLINEQIINYQIFDAKGASLRKDQVDGDIDVSNLNTGIYFIQLIDENGKSLGAEQFEVIR